MKRIINGKTYNTETAQHICDLPSPTCDESNFNYNNTSLYRAKKGTYFIAGEGGYMSQWSRREENSWVNGSGIRVITKKEAQELAEDSNIDPDDFVKAGFSLEEG